MTNANESQYRPTFTDTSIAPPASNIEYQHVPFETPHDQQHSSDLDVRHRDARRTNSFQSDDKHAAIGVSPRSTVIGADKFAAEEASTSPRVKRSSSSTTDTSNSDGTQHSNAQDARPDASSRIHLINRDASPNTPVHSANSAQDEFRPDKHCPTRRKFRTARFTWLSVTIVLICSVSTALSALFVVLALKGQRYGDYIGNSPGATLSISTAILLTSVVAKTIETSFVTGFVAFLGQVISRRAFIESNDRGVTLSELTMWRWVVQPGSLVTSSEIAKYAGLSTLGLLTLLSTVLSTLYVTAATALVQPISRQSDWRAKTMAGLVQTEFANIDYLESHCHIPSPDKIWAGEVCLQIESAGKSFYNMEQFLANWDDMVNADRDVSTNQEDRPAWIGMPYANATVVPQWVHVVDTAEVSKRYQRVVNNVSLALPHIGVSNATRDQRNAMPRSDTSDSIEAYSLWASVPSPVMKVLCVHMTRTELEPIVYTAWPNDDMVDSDSWNMLPGIRNNATTANKTVVDELFGWTKEDNITMIDYPPVFPKYPLPFNTVVNHTSWAQGRTAIYVLGQGGDTALTNLTDQYPLCKLEVDISPRCSTRHSVSVSGSKVEALCEERADDMAYFRTKPNATTTRGVKNWRDVGTAWANSLSLGMGIENSNLSQSRILMMLALEPEDANPTSFKVDLSSNLPSLAETLAITASDTLLSSIQGAPFVDEWNYTHPMLDEPVTQWFPAKMKSQEYASGGVDDASKGWLVVLISTFLLNVVVLVYFILQPGLVTDFSQPPQLFALAVNSPPTQALAGSCGGGPEGKEYKIGWHIGYEGGHVYIEPKSGREPTFITDEFDSNRVSAHQTADQKAPTGSSLISTISTALGRMKPKSRSRTQRPVRRSTTSGAEPFRSSHTTESLPSLGSHYELGGIEARTK